MGSCCHPLAETSFARLNWHLPVGRGEVTIEAEQGSVLKVSLDRGQPMAHGHLADRRRTATAAEGRRLWLMRTEAGSKTGGGHCLRPSMPRLHQSHPCGLRIHKARSMLQHRPCQSTKTRPTKQGQR